MTEDDNDMAERLAAKWGVKPEEVAEQKRVEKDRSGKPLPVRVTVEVVQEPLRDVSSYMPPVGNRYFFVGYGADGGQWPIMNTTNEAAAKREIDHWQKLGIPMEKAKR